MIITTKHQPKGSRSNKVWVESTYSSDGRSTEGFWLEYDDSVESQYGLTLLRHVLSKSPTCRWVTVYDANGDFDKEDYKWPSVDLLPYASEPKTAITTQKPPREEMVNAIYVHTMHSHKGSLVGFWLKHDESPESQYAVFLLKTVIDASPEVHHFTTYDVKGQFREDRPTAYAREERPENQRTHWSQ